MNISKSSFNHIMKSLGKNPKFEELKSEVIEILKKQAKSEKEDFKKSVLANENKYSYIVKSVTGEFFVKSGYPVGTIREWKGKKYMKISPTKWVRKYDKGRHRFYRSM